ncbi:MAG: tetratricopeptide repeat protein [Chryseotalea sp.]
MRYMFVSRIFVCACLLTGPISLVAQVSKFNESGSQYYSKAIELFDAGNYPAAKAAATSFLNSVPTDELKKSQATFLVAASSLRNGEALGVEQMNAFIQTQTGIIKRAHGYCELGNYWYTKQNYAKAAASFEKTEWHVLPLYLQMKGRFQWGYSFFSEKKLKEANEQFNQVKKGNHEYTSAASYYAGFIALTDEDYATAIDDLKTAGQNELFTLAVPYLLATAYYKQGDFKKVIDYARPLLASTEIKNKRETGILLAEAYYQQNDFTNAASTYLTYLDADKTKDEAILYRAGLSLARSEKWTEAIPYLESAATAESETAKLAAFQLGIAYLETGNKIKAQNAFSKSRTSENKNVAEQSTFTFSKVCYDIGQSEKAITELEVYLKQYPSGVYLTEARELLSQAYINGNNYNKAIEYIESLPAKNLVIQQAYQKATYLKAVEHYNKEEWAEASEMFKRSLSYPVDAKYVQRASVWYADLLSSGNEQNNESPIFYEKSLSVKEGDPLLQAQALYGLGYLYFKTKDYTKAKTYFAEMVNSKQTSFYGFSDGLLRLADCLYIEKNYDQSLKHYTQYRNLYSNDRDYATLQSGMIFGIQQRYTEARQQFRSLVQDYPNSVYRAEGLYQYAQFELEQSNFQAAVQALTDLITSEKSSAFLPYALARRAAAYYNLKDYTRCVQDYAEVVTKYTARPIAQEVLLPLQEALSLTGKATEFDQYLTLVKNASSDLKGLENLEFESAKKLYFDENYDVAIRRIDEFLKNYPESKNKTEAVFYQAESYYRKRNWAKAVSLYSQIKEDKEFLMAARVATRMADCYNRLGDFTNAIPAYRYATQFAATKRDWYIAYSGLMESFFQISHYDSAGLYAQYIIDRANINVTAENKASLYLGKVALAKGNFELAEDELLNTLNAARDESGAEANYLLATVFYLKGNYKQCNETLFSLNQNFSAYENWIGKSFLLLADSYTAQKEVFQAKATLQSLLDNFPDEKIKQEAKQKLQNLENTRQQQLAADTLQNEN